MTRPCLGHETTDGPIGSTVFCDGSCRKAAPSLVVPTCPVCGGSVFQDPDDPEWYHCPIEDGCGTDWLDSEVIEAPDPPDLDAETGDRQ